MECIKSLTAPWDKATKASIVSFFVLLAAYCAFDAAGFVIHESSWTTPSVIAVFVALIAALALRPRVLGRYERIVVRAKPFVLGALVLLAFYLFEKPYNPALFDIGAYYTFVNLCVIASCSASSISPVNRRKRRRSRFSPPASSPALQITSSSHSRDSPSFQPICSR